MRYMSIILLHKYRASLHDGSTSIATNHLSHEASVRARQREDVCAVVCSDVGAEAKPFINSSSLSLALIVSRGGHQWTTAESASPLASLKEHALCMARLRILKELDKWDANDALHNCHPDLTVDPTTVPAVDGVLAAFHFLKAMLCKSKISNWNELDNIAFKEVECCQHVVH